MQAFIWSTCFVKRDSELVIPPQTMKICRILRFLKITTTSSISTASIVLLSFVSSTHLYNWCRFWDYPFLIHEGEFEKEKNAIILSPLYFYFCHFQCISFHYLLGCFSPLSRFTFMALQESNTLIKIEEGMQNRWNIEYLWCWMTVDPGLSFPDKIVAY